MTSVAAATNHHAADSPAATVTDAATTVPLTATPRDEPTCRLVEATAAATPAWLRGMPLTAVLVMGGFTRPKPIP